MKIVISSDSITDYETVGTVEKIIYDAVSEASSRTGAAFLFESEAARKESIGAK